MGAVSVSGGGVSLPLAGTSVSPDFGSQDIRTSGRVLLPISAGTVATTGKIAFDYAAASRVLISARNSSDNGDWDIVTMAGSATTFGINGGIGQLRGDRVDIVPGASGLTITANGTAKGLVTSAGWQFGPGAVDFGGGSGAILGIDNAGTVPTTNPTSGAIDYCEAGARKVRGSGGTVTTIAPA